LSSGRERGTLGLPGRALGAGPSSGFQFDPPREPRSDCRAGLSRRAAIREIAAKGRPARFKKTERGMFEHSGVEGE
jgi:hypothetical protein